MATKQQIPKIAASLVEFQDGFKALSTDDGQFVIQRTEEAIKIFVSAVQSREVAVKDAQKTASPIAPVTQFITSTPYLRPVVGGADLSIGILEPKLIADAKDVFELRIDPNFVDYGLNKLGGKTKPITARGYELYKNGTIRDIFTSFGVKLEKLWLSQSQIIDICQYTQKLRQKECANLFLMKKYELLPAAEDNLFVADMHVYPGGLNVYAYRFSNLRVWGGEDAGRVFVPLVRQLEPLAA